MKIAKTEKFEKYSKSIMPYLKNNKNQNFLFIFLTVGASIFFILFAINPTISTIAKLQKEIEDSRITEQQMSEKINNLSALSSAYPQIENDISFIKDAVPQKPEAPILIGQIQQLANESGINIGNVDISPIKLTAGNNSSESFNFTTTVGGQFNDFIRFLDYMVNMQRALSIDSILITKIQSDNHVVTATIKGTAYFKK